MIALNEIARRANEWEPYREYVRKMVWFPNGLYAICPPPGWMGLDWIEMAHEYPSIVVMAFDDQTVIDRMEIKL